MKNYQKIQSKRRNSGYLLIELSIVIVVTVLLSIAGLKNTQERIERLRLDHAGAEMEQILEAGTAYYSEYRVFPTRAQLEAEGLVPSTQWASPFVNDYVVSTQGSGANLRFRISLNTTSRKFANALTAYVPYGRLSNSTTVIGEVVRNGNENAHLALYARDGSNGPMLADVDMNGFSLRNGVDIWANRFCDRNNSRCVDPSGTTDLNTLNTQTINNSGTITADDFVIASTGQSLLESFTYGNVAAPGERVSKLNCPPGYTAKPYVIPAMFSNNGTGVAIGGLQSWATNYSSTQWQIGMRIFTKDGFFNPSATFGEVPVLAKCEKN